MTRDKIREAVEELSDERAYVKSKQIAEVTDLSTSQVGQALPELEGDIVERYSSGGRSTVWRITK